MKVSILVPTMDSEPYLRFTIENLRRNISANQDYEILVAVNGPSPDCVKTARELEVDQLLTYKDNMGLAYVINRLVRVSTGDILFYSMNDVYCAPNWDKAFWERYDPGMLYQFLAAPMFYPVEQDSVMRMTNRNRRISQGTINCGATVETFNEQKFVDTWYDARLITRDFYTPLGPFFIKKALWERVDGFDERFWPCYGTDPDFVAKIQDCAEDDHELCVLRGITGCGIYHFGSVDGGKLVPLLNRPFYINLAERLFHDKWGLSIHDFDVRIKSGEDIDD